MQKIIDELNSLLNSKRLSEDEIKEAEIRIIEFVKKLSYELHLVHDGGKYKVTEEQISNTVNYFCKGKLSEERMKEFVQHLKLGFQDQYNVGLGVGKKVRGLKK